MKNEPACQGWPSSTPWVGPPRLPCIDTLSRLRTQICAATKTFTARAAINSVASKRYLLEGRTIDIKKRKDTAELHPEAVFAHKLIGTKELADALLRIGEHVAGQGMVGEGPYRAARDLLNARRPAHWR